jgi:hypothetical protein
VVEEDHKTPLINRHFGILAERKAFELDHTDTGLVRNDPKKGRESTIWRPCTTFPRIENDILLYTTLTGNKEYNAIMDNEARRIPFRRAMEELVSNVNVKLNSNQKSNDGMELESIVAGSICLASHRCGFAGTTMEKLLTEFFYEMDLTGPGVQEISTKSGVKNFLKLRVPFLSPPNQQWPKYLMDSALELGNLVRTSNNKKIDLRAPLSTGMLTAECKDHEASLPTSTIEQILLRVPSTSKVHLVVAKRLQDEYFTEQCERTFDDLISSLPRKKAAILSAAKIFRCRLNQNNKKIEFSRIDGLTLTKDPRTPDKIILLISLEDFSFTEQKTTNA